MNRLGAVALKHGCPDTCLQMLNSLYGYNAMEVQEAFVKIKEQAEAHLDRGLADVTLGLNIINTTNLDYFQPNHQAELFRLKALMLQASGADSASPPQQNHGDHASQRPQPRSPGTLACHRAAQLTCSSCMSLPHNTTIP